MSACVGRSRRAWDRAASRLTPRSAPPSRRWRPAPRHARTWLGAHGGRIHRV